MSVASLQAAHRLNRLPSPLLPLELQPVGDHGDELGIFKLLLRISDGIARLIHPFLELFVECFLAKTDLSLLIFIIIPYAWSFYKNKGNFTVAEIWD